MGIARWYKRLRHTYGFGIHSPSAYELIMEVIRRPRGCACYAPDSLLYRLIAHYCPAKIEVRGHCDEYEAIARSAAQTSVVKAEKFIIVCKNAPDSMIEPSTEGTEVIYFDDARSPVFARLAGEMKRGHIFASKRRALAVCDPRLPLQTFTLNF